MTVKQLIEKLSACNPESPVLVLDAAGWTYDGYRDGYRDAHRLANVRVAPRNTSAYYPRFFNLPERNTIEAVCLE